MKATAEETAGAFLLFEDEVVKGKTTPLHAHADEEEMLYLLEGEARIHIDGSEHELRAGGMALAPRGVPHAFLITSATARLLTLLVPGSAESFYRGASEPAGVDASADGPVDFARVGAAAERCGGMQLLGPPPFD